MRVILIIRKGGVLRSDEGYDLSFSKNGNNNGDSEGASPGALTTFLELFSKYKATQTAHTAHNCEAAIAEYLSPRSAHETGYETPATPAQYTQGLK